MRAIAVIAVVLFHAQWSPAGGGFLGVSLFFTLSGFLITTLLLTEFAEHGDLSLRGFYGRRARRLLPAAYVCVLLVAALSGWWAASQQSELPGDLLASVANVANWRFAFAEGSYQDLFVDQPSPVAHFWSLAIEEQVYLVLPIVVLLALRRGRRSLAVATGLLLAGSVIATLLTVDRDLVYNGTHTRVAEVLIGAALAQFLAARGGEVFRPLRFVTSGTGAAMSVCFIGLIVFAGVEQSWIYRGGLPIVAVLSAVLIAAVVTGRFPARVLEHRVLVSIGAVSYGIYLFHWPVFLLLDPERTGLDGVLLFALRCAVTAALTVVSYRFIEQPVRRGRVGRSKRVVAPMMATGALAVAAAAFLIVPQPTLTPTEELLALGGNDVLEFVAPINESSDDAAPAGERKLEEFDTSEDDTTTVPPAPARVVVVGSDSGAVRSLRSVEGIEVIDAVRPDCLLMPAEIEGCVPLAAQVASLRTEHDPSLVIIASGQGEHDLAVLQNDAANNDRALNNLVAVHDAAIQMLLRVIDESAAAGVPVILSSAIG